MRNEQHGDAWIKGHLNIRPSNLTIYQLVFEAITGDGKARDASEANNILNFNLKN